MIDKQKCDGCRANEAAAIACLKLGGDELSSWQRTCWECAAQIRALRSGCECLPVCYGIVNAAGEMHTSECCVSSDADSLSEELESLQFDEPDDGWEIVPFYAAAPAREEGEV